MDLREITAKQKVQYNKLVDHVMQSWEWGEFRQSFGTKLKRYGLFTSNKMVSAFQLTFHPIPFTKKFVGYFPKGPMPDKNLIEALEKIGKQENCAFIKLEPNAETTDYRLPTTDLKPSPKPLFTKYNFVLDLTKSEEELLKNMHQKTRYNVRLAEKKGVKVEEREDDQAFEDYLKLYFETTSRQKYHGHNKAYHLAVWEALRKAKMARILIASYNSIPLTTWMLFNFKDTLYYPYGGSSKAHPEVMSNNLVAWEAIKLGKRLKLKKFDMWGALGPDADPKDSWFGFHKFKQGYGGRLVEYVGTFDLILDSPLYYTFTFIDKLMPLKVFLLKWISH
ncbi:peptidoglycan bridge formation glycyltransferase FemA/FemB family protein [Patescibacteria group bacterium]|nr:peptidoglycan bridge formation glycyltransferase FemA/FemB family protein [Patescibacteria group bacterium]